MEPPRRGFQRQGRAHKGVSGVGPSPRLSHFPSIPFPTGGTQWDGSAQVGLWGLTARRDREAGLALPSSARGSLESPRGGETPPGSPRAVGQQGWWLCGLAGTRGSVPGVFLCPRAAGVRRSCSKPLLQGVQAELSSSQSLQSLQHWDKLGMGDSPDPSLCWEGELPRARPGHPDPDLGTGAHPMDCDTGDRYPACPMAQDTVTPRTSTQPVPWAL